MKNGFKISRLFLGLYPILNAVSVCFILLPTFVDTQFDSTQPFSSQIGYVMMFCVVLSLFFSGKDKKLLKWIVFICILNLIGYGIRWIAVALDFSVLTIALLVIGTILGPQVGPTEPMDPVLICTFLWILITVLAVHLRKKALLEEDLEGKDAPEHFESL